MNDVHVVMMIFPRLRFEYANYKSFHLNFYEKMLNVIGKYTEFYSDNVAVHIERLIRKIFVLTPCQDGEAAERV